MDADQHPFDLMSGNKLIKNFLNLIVNHLQNMLSADAILNLITTTCCVGKHTFMKGDIVKIN
jgi:hypothetical protein